VILLTNKQTKPNADENITSLAEVDVKKYR